MAPNILDFTRAVLDEAAQARKPLVKENVRFLGRDPNANAGDYFANYGRMIKNRMLDLYDDCILLLDNNRVPSACDISRCMMETHAVGAFFCNEVESALQKSGIGGVQKVILRFINSSRMKVDEQKRLKKGVFKAMDFQFTNEARYRMENELAASSHIADSMKYFFERNKEVTNSTESPYQLVYAGLCEWTHPSQTSLFHAYTKDAQAVKTSLGTINILDGARLACAQGMSFITATEGHFQHMLEAAEHLASLDPKSA
jgi:hypothetical protein